MASMADLPTEALNGSLRDYKEIRGVDLLGRTDGFYAWQDLRRAHKMWPYSKSTDTAPKTTCIARDDMGGTVEGVNFASQDYLSLSSHPKIKEAAIMQKNIRGIIGLIKKNQQPCGHWF